MGLYLAQQPAAGRWQPQFFSPAAIERMAHHSQGILRAIAVLRCILLASSLYSEREITPIYQRSRLELFSTGSRRQRRLPWC